MPITFPDILGVTGGQTYPVVDATTNSVKGIGFYTDLQDAIDNTPNYAKTPGYLAVITTPERTLYQFVASSVDDWANTEFWSEKGEALPPEAVQEKFYAEREFHVNLFGKHNPSATDTYKLDLTAIPIASQLMFTSGNQVSSYDVFTQGAQPSYLDQPNTWIARLFNTSGPYATVDAADAVTAVAFNIKVSLGYEHVLPSFLGFDDTEKALISPTPSWAGTTTIEDYLKTVPESLRPQVVHLFMPTDSAISDELYIGYTPPAPAYNSYGDTDWIDPANWTVLTAAATNTISTQVVISSSPDKDTFFIAGSYPITAAEPYYRILDADNATASLTFSELEDAQVMLSFNTEMRTHLESLKANTTTLDEANTISLTFAISLTT